MPPAARRAPFVGHIPTPAEQHADWLRLLRPDGPFVALPVLTEVFPQGLDTVAPETQQRLRQAWEEVQEDPALLRHGWERLILDELLGWAPGLREGAALPESVRAGANTRTRCWWDPARTAPPHVSSSSVHPAGATP
ncbi:hypothetical protein ID875_13130 [Streptomyces globisporus]|uniref:Uncharacterized protein n=1 Tax=Streptomyces globisporus TaxID=1908 RepID=A0A927GNL4_STRGL|nr:hypothetical protein [Streptomyces globisporus]